MEEVIGWTLVVVLVIGVIYLLWPSREPSELESVMPDTRNELQATQDELLGAQAEIVLLDAELEICRRERAEFEDDNYALTQSIEHTIDRLRSSEEIRLKLAASLSGRCCGGQITMGNTEAKVVHGGVVVSDPDADSRRNV